MKDRLKFFLPLILFALTIILVINERYEDAFTSFFLMIGGILFYLFKVNFSDEEPDTTTYSTKAKINNTPYHVYYGDELNLSNNDVSNVLTRRFPYFNTLSQDEKSRFLERLQKFMADKTFKIHGDRGFKEMPILISAAAIQLTFGLSKFMLPHFEFIHIHPEEFLRVKPVICFLEGNVSGHSINLSWKHFLEGYANPTDGENVGLHELAHALYYQTFEVERNVDKNFRRMYDSFNIDGNKAFNTEKTVAGGLYSEYAEKNFQEFWAESVELFFEKPADMDSLYPQLYQTMKLLLNQDPLNNIHSMSS